MATAGSGSPVPRGTAGCGGLRGPAGEDGEQARAGPTPGAALLGPVGGDKTSWSVSRSSDSGPCQAPGVRRREEAAFAAVTALLVGNLSGCRGHISVRCV